MSRTAQVSFTVRLKDGQTFERNIAHNNVLYVEGALTGTGSHVRVCVPLDAAIEYLDDLANGLYTTAGGSLRGRADAGWYVLEDNVWRRRHLLADGDARARQDAWKLLDTMVFP